MGGAGDAMALSHAQSLRGSGKMYALVHDFSMKLDLFLRLKRTDRYRRKGLYVRLVNNNEYSTRWRTRYDYERMKSFGFVTGM